MSQYLYLGDLSVLVIIINFGMGDTVHDTECSYCYHALLNKVKLC